MLSLLGAGVCRLPSAHSGQHQDVRDRWHGNGIQTGPEPVDWRSLLATHTADIRPILAERTAFRRTLIRWRQFMVGHDVGTVRLLTHDLWRSRYGMARSVGWANVERELGERC